MKKTIKKSLIILFAIVMVMAAAMPVVLANATVSITFDNHSMESDNSSDGLVVSNLYPTTSTNVSNKEGYHINDGIIKFNFSQEMDVSTLTPENIKITLKNGTYMDNRPQFNASTMEWSYTPYEVTETSYSISIADMCEGKQPHTVTFTSGVKTKDGESIVPVEKKFTTGRITTTAGVEGKSLMDVAYKKTVTIHENDGTEFSDSRNPSLLVDFSTGAWGCSSECVLPIDDRYVRIDLGNYYNIYDLILYEVGGETNRAHQPIDVYYTNDPAATPSTATLVGSFADNIPFPSSMIQGSDDGLRGTSRYLSPAAPFRARYILVKNTGSAGENTGTIKVIADVDTDFGQMTAKKDGTAVTQFAGTGTYEVTVPVKENREGTAKSYMIVAGYDANGIVTKINCAPVNVSNGGLTLSTNIENSNTKSLKAILIKGFNEPQMLTDALILPAQ